MPTSNPQPGSVIGIPFPFSDRLAEKFRPSLVLSVSDDSAPYTLIWAAMITSARTQPWAGDISIKDLKAAGLKRPSVIRPLKLVTVEESRVEWVAGRVTPDEFSTCVRWVVDRILASRQPII